MALNSPQPWSLIGLAISILSAWRATTAAATSSQSRYSSARPPSSGWVDGELGRWRREDQPAAASVDRPGSQHLGQCGPGRLGVVAVEDGVGALDHRWILPLAALQDAADKAA
jgi:hypothetical protein